MNPVTIANKTTTSPSQLDDLVGDAGAFLFDDWGVRPRSYQCPTAPGLLTQAEIWDMLDCGLLLAPYFSVLTQTGAAMAGVSETRSVQGRPMPSYAKAVSIRDKVAAGRTLVLHQADHWHIGLNDLAASLRTTLRADVRAAVFVNQTGVKIAANTEEAHQLILQLEGRTNWYVSCSPGSDEDSQEVEVALEPGGTLYIPAGHQYSGTTGDGTSLHVAISVLQPTARDLTELALDQFCSGQSAEGIAGSHHLMTLETKVAWLRAELIDHLTSLDVGALVDEAVTIRQQAGHA